MVPKEPPVSLTQAAVTVIAIGGLSGAITSLAAAAVDRAKKWSASPLVRLALGGLAAAAAAGALMIPRRAQSGLWARRWLHPVGGEPRCTAAHTVRRGTAAGCNHYCGRGSRWLRRSVRAVPRDRRHRGSCLRTRAGGGGNDLAGAAGAAGGIAGGYRLPFTAVAMVLGVGGPRAATLTCLGVVLVAYLVDQANPFKAHVERA